MKMPVVAALFDSQADATEAMDVLLNAHIKDLDTKVYETGSRQGMSDSGPGVVVPLVPSTGSGMGQPGMPAAGALGAAGLDRGWLNELDEEERAFYYEGYREGATLALAKVHAEDVGKVRQVLGQHNCRTYVKD
jgi:hypothetical protein